ncbi:hypothetical protein PR048_009413 [Dryococelus australis]|uniref:Uncharacterized protein n=1 Tax=Dryococelus australis TaxID=614101 RepID=A0ABQ9HZW8_9NEOP|nr:hypothetical protein PR048_009413 [Dryococelus australis]
MTCACVVGMCEWVGCCERDVFVGFQDRPPSGTKEPAQVPPAAHLAMVEAVAEGQAAAQRHPYRGRDQGTAKFSSALCCLRWNMDAFETKQELLQKLEEKAQKAQEAFEREEKARKELEVLNSKLLQEKTDLLSQLEGEKGSLSDFQEKSNKLQAQKADVESQLHVSTAFFRFSSARFLL